jgi:hypothetical protein
MPTSCLTALFDRLVAKLAISETLMLISVLSWIASYEAVSRDNGENLHYLIA